MYKVLVGVISPEGANLLTSYLEKFMPGTEIEPLKPVGIKGRMKNHAVRQDVLLVVLDDSLWQACVGVCDAVLALPKVHKYESDEGLKAFLESKFGLLETCETGVIPPDQLMGESGGPEDDYVPKTADLSKDSATSATVPPDKLNTVVVEDEDFVGVDSSDEVEATDTPSEVTEKLNSQIRDLQSKLASKEILVRSLTLQLKDKTASEEGDISALVGRIKELENELTEKENQLNTTTNDTYVNLGKVAHAEQVLGEFESLRGQVRTLTEEKAAVEGECSELEKRLQELKAEVGGLHERVSQIPELQKGIEEKERRVVALEHELTAKTETISDLEAKLKEVTGVVSEITQLQSELEVLQKEISDDKAKLRRLDEAEAELSARQLTIDNLGVDIEALTTTVNSQNEELKRLRSELTGKGEALAQALQDLELCRESLRLKTAELSESEAARQEAVTNASNSAQRLAENAESLERRVAELTEELSGRVAETEAFGEKLANAEDAVRYLTQELEDVRHELTEKCDECTELSFQLESLRGSSSDLEAAQGQLNAEATQLREQLNRRDADVDRLQGEVASLTEAVGSKDTELTSLREQLDTSRQELLDAKSASDTATITADTQKAALERVLEEKKGIEDRLVAAESRCFNYEAKIHGLEDELTQEREFGGSLSDANVELSAQNDKLNNIIKQLEEDLVRATADDGMVSRLENDLLEERRRSARLQSEVEVLKKTSDTEKTSDLRIEIARLKSELTNARGNSASSEELEGVRAELASSRERAAQLELELVSKDRQISSMSDGVFAQLRRIAIPKGVYDLKMPELGTISSKFMCVASGSEESTANVYQSLRMACAAHSGKKIVIVDMTTDSCIDKEFGLKKIASPIDWLSGDAQFRPYLTETRYGNVKVLSTAFAYMNDLFLLTVDWRNRLLELDGFSADVVVLCVGCLNNLTSKGLFDMFSHSMKSSIIVKATPVNLRTVILNLTGFKELSSSVTVECVNFSDTSSAAMYQRLVAKYNAHILRDNEVLAL